MPSKDPQVHKNWIANNRDKARAIDRKSYYKNREKILERNKQEPKKQIRQQIHKKSYIKNREKRLNKAKIIRQARMNIINQYKDKPCALCGKQYDPICLDFHHLDKSYKKIEISMVRSLEVTLTEIERCLLVCANCHWELNNAGKYEKYPKWFLEFRSTLYCERCGIHKSLEFHHINPKTKIMKISQMVCLTKKYTKEEVLEEIRKCCVICTCCHRLEHNIIPEPVCPKPLSILPLVYL